MTGRLPFTLAPLDGEPFGLWLHAYAARLAMSPGHLAETLGMPARQPLPAVQGRALRRTSRLRRTARDRRPASSRRHPRSPAGAGNHQRPPRRPP